MRDIITNIFMFEITILLTLGIIILIIGFLGKTIGEFRKIRRKKKHPKIKDFLNIHDSGA